MKRLVLLVLLLAALLAASGGGYLAGRASAAPEKRLVDGLAQQFGVEALRAPSPTPVALEDWIPPGARTVQRAAALRSTATHDDVVEATTVADCVVLASKEDYEAVLAFYLSKIDGGDQTARAREAWKGGTSASSGAGQHVVRAAFPRPAQDGAAEAAPHARSNLLSVRRSGLAATIVLQRAKDDVETFVTIVFDGHSRVAAPSSEGR